MFDRRSSLTEGSIWKGMLLFALPVLLGNIFQQFYNTFDSWVVGKFIGENGIGFGLVCAMLMAETVGILSYLFAPQLIGFFNSDPEVVDFGPRHMRTICLFYCLLALSHCIAAVMRGAGKATVPMVTMLVCWA